MIQTTLNKFEPWQMKVFAKNAKKGIVFFRPDSFERPTPRSAREAWGGTYHKDDFTKNEVRNEKILVAIVFVSLIMFNLTRYTILIRVSLPNYYYFLYEHYRKHQDNNYYPISYDHQMYQFAFHPKY